MSSSWWRRCSRLVAMLLLPSATKALLTTDCSDPFAVVDAQTWVNPDNMTWDDYVKPPGSDWNSASRKGSVRNFNIALVAVDYADKPFAITGPPRWTIFGNPLPQAANIARADVAGFYRGLLNEPSALNRGHTLHEYWMEDSGGRFGVDLTSFGVYRLPLASYQYGLEDDMNAGTPCPLAPCNVDLRNYTLDMWRTAIGRDEAARFEMVFILSAGQDESSTWQEFGPIKFASRDAVPDAFGPPAEAKRRNSSLANWASTRYYPWTSWAAASTIWPNAQDASSIQCESSGMATYAHELSHLLHIGDNYNNPYGTPLRRSYTGPWSMLSRGSFNGPGGPHSRWHIPPLQGGSLGSLHTMRDKKQLGLVSNSSILIVTRQQLAASGLLVAQITSRTVHRGLMGVRVEMDGDRSPPCDTATQVLCDGGGYDNYEVEVVDRMGADSFQPDAGVMISKTKNMDSEPFQWTIDANPQDINVVDFYDANATAVMVTMGDYRQLADALFHAGTRSGSKYEYVDAANRLHLYIVDKHRADDGVLSYTVALRSLDSKDKTRRRVGLTPAKAEPCPSNRPTGRGVVCSFNLTNHGSDASHDKQSHLAAFQGSDVFRLRADVEGSGWRAQVRNALVAVQQGHTVDVGVAVAASADADNMGRVILTAASETDGQAKAQAQCVVQKA
ncbi:hypothetical protein CDD82_6833 [Ophiocordyceps australis]|uniref:Peptidase M6-like domain-containing protein n=1 Tax=Ophiocordyceps australis TaxID=1399860 RepID=A0A2C5ZQP9_9HYPO|nr:hypothetical protein CDD82_6833 [Ophiocordyceps australis]